MQLAGTQGRACLSRSRILSDLAKPAVRESGGDFFRYTDAEKILPLARCAWTGHVWPDKTFRRWAHYVLFLFRSCPARRRGYGRIRPDMTCQGRQGRSGQASLPWM